MKFKKVVLSEHMVRKNKKQKEKFINYVKDELKDTGFDVNVEKGSFGVRNIVIGNVDEASVVFTAHYDTCAVMPLPNFITPTNMFIYFMYQLLLVIPMILFAILVTALFDFVFPNMGELSSLVYSFSLLFILGLMIFGPANKNTVNDNTSGTLTILEMINKIPDKLKNKVAFVLFDLEESGLIGSSEFSSKHKKIMKDKLLINFDCVSDGEKMLFVPNKKAKKFIDLLEDVYKTDDKVEVKVVTKGVFYPSDQVNFNCGVGVCAVIKGKRFEYIDKIHTNKDVVCREENIEYLVDNSIKLVEKI